MKLITKTKNQIIAHKEAVVGLILGVAIVAYIKRDYVNPRECWTSMKPLEDGGLEVGWGNGATSVIPNLIKM